MQKRREVLIKDIADAICISGTVASHAIEQLINNGLLECRKGALMVTEAGLQALEPYRVKRAVIMAAGFGSQMMPATADRPKPLVTVNGVRILDTFLDLLVTVGITDITIVRGYKKERFNELLLKYPFIKLIDNDIYDQTNNISSAILALDLIDSCYLCEADLYISYPVVITKYRYCSNILGSYSLETDDWSFKMNNGFISEYQKGNTYCYNYYGISYWTHEDSVKLREDFRDMPWDEVAE